MTFSTDVPNASQSPGQFPPQAKANWTRLQAMINGDHQFNNTQPAPNNDGYHKVVHWVNQVGAFGDGTPANIVGTGQLYTKNFNSTQHMFYRSGTTNVEIPITPVPIWAYVSFIGSSAAIQGTAFNCTVVRTNSGRYTLTFAPALPSANYVPVIQHMRNTALVRAGLIGTVVPSTTYSDSVTASTLKIQFTDGAANFEDPLRVMVAIVGGW